MTYEELTFTCRSALEVWSAQQQALHNERIMRKRAVEETAHLRERLYCAGL